MSKSHKGSPRFTVFTPSYNRAHTLHRVYDSLKAQTFRDFEWIVIDDGSNDNTLELVEGWQVTADFPIQYIYQKNAGKHIAFNRGVAMARGELFLPIDSDDGFLPESLAVLIATWENISEEKRSEFTGVVTLCQSEGGEIYGDLFKTDPLDTNALDLSFVFKKRGETWGFHRTDILKEYPFPEDGGVRFVPENFVWGAIARKYKVRCINKALRVFYQDSGNQITKSDPRKKALVKDYFVYFINRDIDYAWHDPRTFIKWAALYVRYSLHTGSIDFLSPKMYQNISAYLLCLGAMPIGISLYILDYLKRSPINHEKS